MVYTSASASLSALETRVHLNPALRFHYLIFPIEFDERFVEKLPPASLPAGWWDEPPPPATKRHLILSSYQVNDWGHEKPPRSFLTGLS